MYQPAAPIPGTLHVPPMRPMSLTNAQVRRTIDNFVSAGSSFHSRGASLLQVVLDHCHQSGTAYTLGGVPEGGYFVKAMDSVPDVSGLPDADPTTTVAALIEAGQEFQVVFAPGVGFWVSDRDIPENTVPPAASR